jgi:hypothetical protein
MDHTVGYVLLGSAAVPALIGWSLSLKGLSGVDAAAKKAKQAARDALEQTATTQQLVAMATPGEVHALANATENIATQLATVDSTISGVEDALKAMTGRLAPARVAFALATMLAVAALFALGVISASAGSGGTATTTSSTPSTPTP